MQPGNINVALRSSVGVVAVSHVQVSWKPINPLCVLVPCMHQGQTAVARCANQTVGMTLKQSIVMIHDGHDHCWGRATCENAAIRRSKQSSGCTCCWSTTPARPERWSAANKRDALWLPKQEDASSRAADLDVILIPLWFAANIVFTACWNRTVLRSFRPKDPPENGENKLSKTVNNEKQFIHGIHVKWSKSSTINDTCSDLLLFCLQEIKKFAVVKLFFPGPCLRADFLLFKVTPQFPKLMGTDTWQEEKTWPVSSKSSNIS